MSKLDSKLQFKIASTDEEFDQINKLNYKTFVEEIKQHPQNPKKYLVDKFHAENTYIICLENKQVIAMVSLRGNRPFSLDQKIPDLDSFFSNKFNPCEIRLLSIENNRRSGRILQGLLTKLALVCVKKGFDIALISGIATQEKLYRRLGFIPFGNPVKSGHATYQPMYKKLEDLTSEWAEKFLKDAIVKDTNE
ncbi:MAG: hypothetical protein FI687_04680 [SAR202 cluster bacterium]|nr:hypothetical protein [SAR202 cluster bacterium]